MTLCPSVLTRSGNYVLRKIKCYHKKKVSAKLTAPAEERRQGVAPASAEYNENDEVEETLQIFVKSAEDENLIRQAVEKNEFLNKLLTGSVLSEIISVLYAQEVSAQEIIIKQGECGSHMYVSAEGQFEVSVKNKIVNTFEDVRVFGELAILYDDKRQATIKAVNKGRIWVLDRSIYQKIMIRSNIKQQEQRLQFLEKVPRLNKVGLEVLRDVTNLLKTEFFATGTVIIKEGDRGHKFYIISAGSVTISKNNTSETWNFKTGEYFGELALLKEDTRQATVIADAPGVECLSLERQQFIDHFGELGEEGLSSSNYPTIKVSVQKQPEFDDIELSDLNTITTLGVGGFGRVDLVQHKTNENLVFALKYLKKVDMVEQNQQEHVLNEKEVQISCNSQFILTLHKTFKDRKYVYFLLESCLGGDVWSLMQRQKGLKFLEPDARFIAGCVLEAFSYLHDRGIVYRDLKPENLLIDAEGYIKLTDFGFAKKLGNRGRTFTFAGTPEYVAPEIILNKGHDKSVDFWTFGILIFELLTGRTPFKSVELSHMKIYNKILSGVEDVSFPSYVGQHAKSLVGKLLKAKASDRLGCLRNGVKDVRGHKFFSEFDWEALVERRMDVPFRPKLRSKVDTRYFEKFGKDHGTPKEETSGWDRSF